VYSALSPQVTHRPRHLQDSSFSSKEVLGNFELAKGRRKTSYMKESISIALVVRGSTPVRKYPNAVQITRCQLSAMQDIVGGPLVAHVCSSNSEGC